MSMFFERFNLKASQEYASDCAILRRIYKERKERRTDFDTAMFEFLNKYQVCYDEAFETAKAKR